MVYGDKTVGNESKRWMQGMVNLLGPLGVGESNN